MPVKKIPKSASASTGRAYSLVAGRSLGHASGLERDAYLASSFLPGLVAIEEQPVRIQSEAHTYHPDTFFRIEVLGHSEVSTKEYLVEIKYISELREKWSELWPRIELGRDYARALGWTFKVITELEIRGSDFHCIRFLRRYLGVQGSDQVREWALEALRIRPLSILELLDDGSRALEISAQKLLPQVWHLIATQEVHLDPL